MPGLGQMALGRRRRGAVFFLLVAVTFALGIGLGGTFPRPVAGDVLSWLGTLVMAGTGVLGASAWLLGWGRAPLSSTWEAGTAFLLTAGIMGVLLFLDVLEKTEGRAR